MNSTAPAGDRRPAAPDLRTPIAGCSMRTMLRLSRTLIQLNLATQEHHIAADAAWLELLVPGVTRARYVEHLIKVYGFEAPLEAALRYTPGLSSVIDVRPRAGLIAQDLMRLGL